MQNALLEESSKLVAEIEDPYFNGKANAVLGVLQGKSGFEKEAEKSFEKAIKSSRKTGSLIPGFKLEILTDVYHYQTQLGFEKEAKDTILQIKKAFSEIRILPAYEASLVCMAFADLKLYKAASELIESIDDPNQKCKALISLAWNQNKDKLWKMPNSHLIRHRRQMKKSQT